MPSIPRQRRGGDRSYQLPKSVGLAGPNTRKDVVPYHKKSLLSPTMMG
jgi:hypothetical protein